MDKDDDTCWLDHLKNENRKRNHNKRASDSDIAAAILVYEPELARAHFRKAIRRLEEYFETALDVTGPQSARDVLERIHLITGDRRVGAFVIQEVGDGHR